MKSASVTADELLHWISTHPDFHPLCADINWYIWEISSDFYVTPMYGAQSLIAGIALNYFGLYGLDELWQTLKD